MCLLGESSNKRGALSYSYVKRTFLDSSEDELKGKSEKKGIPKLLKYI